MTDPGKPKFQAAFASVLGERAGLARSAALFAKDPTPADRAEVARLHDAVAHRNYGAALDELATHPDLVLERPLAAELFHTVCAAVCEQPRDTHVADADALFRLASATATAKTAAQTAESHAVGVVRAWLADALRDGASEAGLRDVADVAVYDSFARVAADALAAGAHDVASWLGTRRTRQLVDGLGSQTALAGLVKSVDWLAVTTRFSKPGLARHNSDEMQARFQSACDDALWQARGQAGAPELPPQS